jgi:DNA repair protein RadD
VQNVKTLRPHQEKAIAIIRQSLGRGNKRVMVQAPTGMGKTVLASHIVQGALNKGKRVMFVVPAISLIEQSVASFEADGVHAIGVVQAQHHRTDASQPVQVCSIQTLMRRDTMPEADIVIIDEAHKWFKFCEGWFEDMGDTPVIGLSATPWTKGLGHHYDDLIIAATTKELIDDGFLSPFKVFAPSSPDMKGVRTTAGDYNEGDLSGLMNNKQLTADIVSTWLAKGEDRQTLVFGVDRLHAKSLQEAFIAAGVVAEYMDANTQLEEREAVFKQFQ